MRVQRRSGRCRGEERREEERWRKGDVGEITLLCGVVRRWKRKRGEKSMV